MKVNEVQSCQDANWLGKKKLQNYRKSSLLKAIGEIFFCALQKKESHTGLE